MNSSWHCNFSRFPTSCKNAESSSIIECFGAHVSATVCQPFPPLTNSIYPRGQLKNSSTTSASFWIGHLRRISLQQLGKSSEILPKPNRDPTNHDMHFVAQVINYLWGRCLTLPVCKSMRLHYFVVGTKLSSNVNKVLFQKVRILSFQHISTIFNLKQEPMFPCFPAFPSHWFSGLLMSSTLPSVRKRKIPSGAKMAPVTLPLVLVSAERMQGEGKPKRLNAFRMKACRIQKTDMYAPVVSSLRVFGHQKKGTLFKMTTSHSEYSQPKHEIWTIDSNVVLLVVFLGGQRTCK